MKKLMHVAALALATQGCLAVDTERIEEAIEQSSRTQVEALLSEVDHEAMSPEVRKEMYTNFYDLAVKTTENRTQNLSMVGNRYDLLKTGSGIALGLLGGLKFYESFGNSNTRLLYSGFLRAGFIFRVGDWARVLSCCFGIPALYLLYKGITCSTQKAEIASAKTIEELIKAKLNGPGVEPALK